MDMYPKYKSKFGYQIGNNQIDSYGVDHSGFNLQDELAYQFAREEKENKLLEQLKSRGITQDLPQYGTNFWGNEYADAFCKRHLFYQQSHKCRNGYSQCFRRICRKLERFRN